MQATLDRIDSPEGFILDPSLVLYLPLYRLDGAFFMSKDAYGHLCTVTGATWGSQGRSFDGTDDYINCGDDTSFDITSAITVEAWIKTNVALLLQHIVGRDDGTNRNYILVIQADGTPNWVLWVSNAAKERTGSLVTAGTWYHLVGTYDGAQSILYTNAVAGSPLAVTGAIDNDDVSLTMGSRAVSLDRDFDGIIGEVRIYNRALTPLEIQNNYLATKWRYK